MVRPATRGDLGWRANNFRIVRLLDTCPCVRRGVDGRAGRQRVNGAPLRHFDVSVYRSAADLVPRGADVRELAWPFQEIDRSDPMEFLAGGWDGLLKRRPGRFSSR